MSTIKIYESVNQLNHAVAEQWVELSKAAIESKGSFHVSLSGGSTPEKLYHLLATEEFKSNIDWRYVHIYFGDERCVAADHPDSNYRMAKQAMLASIDIPLENIHAIEINSDNITASAQRYEQEIIKNVQTSTDHIPTFDLVLLGIGDDGHTASLFPGTPILEEKNKFVDAVYVEKFKAWRISITYPVINAAKNIFILAAGAGKVSILKEILADQAEIVYPIQRIQAKGRLTWYLDKAASEKISNSNIN